MAIYRENYLWHKLHSLTGIIPVGFYMVQHLTLNTFSIAGPEYFNGVIGFFSGMPKHILLAMEIGVIFLPLFFHGIFGLLVTQRMKNTALTKGYGYFENRMYLVQRMTGLLLFILICLHVFTTTISAKYLGAGEESIQYAGMQAKLMAHGYLGLALYAIGVALAAYHLCMGVWNFCIRWGITISEGAMNKMRNICLGLFVAVTMLGWAALGGFLIHDVDPHTAVEASHGTVQVSMAR